MNPPGYELITKDSFTMIESGATMKPDCNTATGSMNVYVSM